MKTVYNPLEKQIERYASIAEHFEYNMGNINHKNFCYLSKVFLELSKILGDEALSRKDFLSNGLISDKSRSLLTKTMGSILVTLDNSFGSLK